MPAITFFPTDQRVFALSTRDRNRIAAAAAFLRAVNSQHDLDAKTSAGLFASYLAEDLDAPLSALAKRANDQRPSTHEYLRTSERMSGSGRTIAEHVLWASPSMGIGVRLVYRSAFPLTEADARGLCHDMVPREAYLVEVGLVTELDHDGEPWLAYDLLSIEERCLLTEACVVARDTDLVPAAEQAKAKV